jgi:uncharacterized membrane protein YdjX (TVP38/TMEM64 family)
VISVMKVTRSIIFVLWVIFLTVCIISYISHPAYFTAENIILFLKNFNNYVLPIYIMIFLLRGFTMLPNTPLVIAGTFLFPGHPYLVLFISISCILITSALIYYFSEFLGFDTFFQEKYPEKMDYIRGKLNKPSGFVFIILWSFFPLAPTDLVSYVSGTIRLNIAKLLLGILPGELALCAFYIFLGKSAARLIN